MQNFWATNKEHYGMLWYFLEWLIHSDENLATINMPQNQFFYILPVTLFHNLCDLQNDCSFFTLKVLIDPLTVTTGIME